MKGIKVKKLFFILALFSLTTLNLAQDNIQVQVFSKEIKVTWDGNNPVAMNWMVCYAQSEDTAGFRFHNFMEGAPYEDMYEWYVYVGPYPFATVWNKSFLFEEDSTQGYIKIGVLAQDFDSTWLTAKTYGPFPAGTLGTPENIVINK